MGASTAGKLTATDRKQLSKITEGRFEILTNQLYNRKDEVHEHAEQQVRAEHEADIKSVVKKLEIHKAKEEKAEEDYNKIQRKLENEKNNITQEAIDLGLELSRSYGSTLPKVEPKDISQAVYKKLADFHKQYKEAQTKLRTLELEVLENISVAGLESDEAKDFLGQIPKIDDLLPAPQEVKELQTS